ncbi:glycerol-3-phosphate dehydrogenase [Hyphomicrobium nitrativorans NL23]|uniref:Glycerol-3-phosphate dehydrogenase n=1 Tax=Hyphomicrobium nitrativorans NL23 TaxID=1029756 RepID=V5SFB3_9HYPH|nr:glycerol-3-phosphate dehydrogenase [Hyphomicrobium nitrativorans]AHB49187.1 glycerol-3-phosphate dehydrogenase [Hyphomicrobium nitrativorans NL23]
MSGTIYDLAIIGGGINGAGIAADAAGRGLRVVLFEKGDLACGTSSASSKLIHGGLRYLEQREFRLVRHALAEREVLLDRAAHLIHPLRFVIPHAAGMRPRIVMRAGLFLYDSLARRRRIPASASVDLTRDPMGAALRPEFRNGFSYHDCWVDDARLVAITALDAAERGAHILTRAPVTRIVREGEGWRIDAEAGGARHAFSARAVVNAAGPWCADVAALARPEGAGSKAAVPMLRLVRGTHIVVPRIPGADDALLLQNADGRVVFVLPFGARFTMIGTTEVVVSTPAEGFVASAEEEAYLIEAAGRYLSHPLTRTDIVWRFAGVRPLVDDGAATASSVTRDWRLDLVQPAGSAPFLNVIGGKITTFRLLAEAVLDRLRPFFPGMGGAWTAHAPLPGGDVGPHGLTGYRADLARRRPGFAPETLDRLAALYGTRADRVIGDAAHDADLGAALGGGLTEREICYLRDTEWARTAEDVLWRRTKAGLDLSAGERPEAEAKIARLVSRT